MFTSHTYAHFESLVNVAIFPGGGDVFELDAASLS